MNSITDSVKIYVKTLDGGRVEDTCGCFSKQLYKYILDHRNEFPWNGKINKTKLKLSETCKQKARNWEGSYIFMIHFWVLKIQSLVTFNLLRW